MINACIVGGADYNTGELARLLINHPDVNLLPVYCPELAGAQLASIHQGLYGERDIRFSDVNDFSQCDVLFLSLGRGKSKQFLASHDIPHDTKIIDLSPDFRLQADDCDNDYVYGLPEYNRKPLVRGAIHASNPGCFATAASLALFPLAKAGVINSTIHITALEGATDAGAEPSSIGHYAWRNENVAVYRPLRHSAADEIKYLINLLQPEYDKEVLLIPMRGSFSRGAIASIYLDCEMQLDDIKKLYDEAYEDHRFTFVIDRQPDLKDVVNTNKCLIHLDKAGGRLIITAAIDNLLKGGAGNAVHIMNLMFGLSERIGLDLKSSAY